MTDFAGPFIPGHVVTAAEWNQSKTAHDEVVSANDVQNGLISALQAADTDLDARMDVVETYAQSIAALTTAQQKAEFLSAVQNPSWFRTLYVQSGDDGPALNCAPSSTQSNLTAPPVHIALESSLTSSNVMARVGGVVYNAYTSNPASITACEFSAVAPCSTDMKLSVYWNTGGTSYLFSSGGVVVILTPDTNERLLGYVTVLSVDETQKTMLFSSASGNGNIYLRTNTGYARFANTSLNAAYPLTMGVKRQLSNKHSYGTATSQGAYDYLWGRSVASANKLVCFKVPNVASPVTTSALSADAGVALYYADVFSVDGSYQFAAAGDGTTVKVSYDPRGSFTWTATYTPAETYNDIINLVVKGRYLVGTRGATSLMWTWYDVTGGTPTLFATGVPMGGIVVKHLPKFGSTNTTLTYHRYVPTIGDCGLGIACDSRLDWNP